MVKKTIKYYILFFLVVLLPLGSCGPKYKAAKAQRQMEKRIEQRRQDGERALLKGKERHQRIQGPEVRKRMKETRRKSDRLNQKRREPFYIRWFYAIRRR